MAVSTDFLEDDIFSQNVLSDPLDEFLKEYFELVKKSNSSPDDNQREIKLITRGPDSHAAQTLMYRSLELETLNIRVKVLFTRLLPTECIDRWIEKMCNDCNTKIKNTIRWSRNPQVLNVHEQLVLGNRMCWSGDTLNRKQEQRSITDIFEHDAPGAARLGGKAFQALWTSASTVSKNQLKQLSTTYHGKQFSPATQDHVLEHWNSGVQQGISTRH